MLNSKEKATHTPVQRKASLALMVWASLLNTPKSRASNAATKTKKPIQMSIMNDSVDSCDGVDGLKAMTKIQSPLSTPQTDGEFGKKRRAIESIALLVENWRSEADLNRCTRFCRPLPSRSATRPCGRQNARSRFGVAKIGEVDMLCKYFGKKS